MELDFEDFIEEVKFQMTEYELLEETTILDWETKAREWVIKHPDKKYLKVISEDDIQVKVKDEDVMYEIALSFYRAVKNNQVEEYWKRFKLI